MDPQPISLDRYWPEGTREEAVSSRCGGEWRITDMREAVKGEPVFDLPLAWIDIPNHKFDLEFGLLDFARHMKHVMDADLSYPIIMDPWGGIIDGRHRIVKALIEGHATIKCVKIPADARPTSSGK